MTGIPEAGSEYPVMELHLRRARSRAGWLPGARGPAGLTSPGGPWPLRLCHQIQLPGCQGAGWAWAG